MNTGNTGLLYNGNSGQLNYGGYQSFHLANPAFAPWEVALTVIVAVVVVATVVVFLRRLRRA